MFPFISYPWYVKIFQDGPLANEYPDGTFILLKQSNMLFLLFLAKSILIHYLAVVDVRHLILPYVIILDVLLVYLLSFRKLPRMLSG